MRTLLLLVVAPLWGCGEEAPPPRNMSADEVAAQLQAVRIAPGLWETSSRVVDVRAPGLPVELRQKALTRGRSVRGCITPEQAQRPSANFLTAQPGANCAYQDFRMEGGRMSGTTICRGGDQPGEVITVVEGQYRPERYAARIETTTRGMPAGADVQVTAEVQGRRIGACPPEQGAT